MFDSTLLDPFSFQNALLHVHRQSNTCPSTCWCVFISLPLIHRRRHLLFLLFLHRVAKKNYLSPFNFFVPIKCDPCGERVSVCLRWMNANDFLSLSPSHRFRSKFIFFLSISLTHRCSTLFHSLHPFFVEKIFIIFFESIDYFRFCYVAKRLSNENERPEKRRRRRKRRKERKKKMMMMNRKKRTELSADEIQFVCTLVMHAYQTPNFFIPCLVRRSLMTPLFFRHIWVISIKMPHAIETKKSVRRKREREPPYTAVHEGAEWGGDGFCCFLCYASSLPRRWYNKCQVFRTSTTYSTIFSKWSDDFHFLQHQQ